MICDVVKCGDKALRFMVDGIGYTKKKPKNEEDVIACWCPFHAEKITDWMRINDKVGKRRPSKVFNPLYRQEQRHRYLN